MIHVAAAAISDVQGRVLVSKRPEHVHQGGLWEFPGGKLKQDESIEEALVRELREELGIQLLHNEPLIRIRHAYGDRSVLLDFRRVTHYSGKVKGLEGQPLRWLYPTEMEAETFPEADRPVITALQLPERYLITGNDVAQPSQFLRRLDTALEQGVGIVQLRAHWLEDDLYRALLLASLSRCHSMGAKLLINRPQGVLDWLGEADGIHFTARQLMSCTRRPLNEGLLGASCHSLHELQQVERLGLNYALLSPVRPTASHPQSPCLGWERFAEWVGSVNFPVYALGGMRPGMQQQAKSYGAQGIAGIRIFWSVNP
ncbi:MAG: Nudix family hydrolase [Candidatus Thiodiazotropha sp. (ex Lucinoma aequizonata)]|nr:Nudix family hydrolase [Candidatus Thiodiazotropha sp. (ex Lucinoma aequizonata)]MCU7886855.1 Nudix family hydrolase [Candidatus Thiodiazotropha sp. (ex Lucinoma aequizonata)]MCU7896123.1 Nudix family hydrolase [Candidatus Thiodiazotropha sp. (ex Lucinoma aequizonata)]MCU7900284.1 Nudix family hydrolase [Candidatus Thiodiazotropha sp. (ex Lucinoma aequizonata)]MCU7902426.1 Nudix family hydrolase [Candidatus Thiodiazotropha sp. (ex Lucinoma aequizonata)]